MHAVRNGELKSRDLIALDFFWRKMLLSLMGFVDRGRNQLNSVESERERERGLG